MTLENLQRYSVEIVIVALVIILTVIYLVRRANAYRKQTPTIAWLNGSYSLLTRMNHWNPVYVGGLQRTFYGIFKVRKVLAAWWGVNKKNALQMVDDLAYGMHNEVFLNETETTGIAFMTDNEFDALQSSSRPKDIPKLQFLHDGYRRFGNKACVAWDLSRGMQLLGQYYVAGYMGYDAALEKSIELGKKAQSVFGSWDAFWDSYLYGYLYWSKNYTARRIPDYTMRMKILDQYRKNGKGPYSQPWNLMLHVDWK